MFLVAGQREYRLAVVARENRGIQTKDANCQSCWEIDSQALIQTSWQIFRAEWSKQLPGFRGVWERSVQKRGFSVDFELQFWSSQRWSVERKRRRGQSNRGRCSATRSSYARHVLVSSEENSDTEKDRSQEPQCLGCKAAHRAQTDNAVLGRSS